MDQEFYSEDNFEVDKDYSKTRWVRGGGGDMSGSSHSSDSQHGVYSAYSTAPATGATSVFSPLSCDNNSDYQLMQSSRRREKSCNRLKEDSPTDNSSPKSAIELAQKTFKNISHSRTKSDITPTAAGSSVKNSKSFSLSRSKSIASARDRWKISSSHGLLPFLSSKNSLNESSVDRAEEQLKKENENLRLCLNTESQERQRLEREVSRYASHVDHYQDQLYELRDQQQQLLATDGGPNESLSIMYSNLLRKYEAGKEEYSKLLLSHSDLGDKSEQYQEQLKQYKTSYENMLNERNKYKQQCTQAIRQWDQVMVEKNKLTSDLKQAMDIRVKASKDIKRLTDQRNNALHENSVIMSERESVHKEMEKLQEQLQNKAVMSKEIELLQREIRAALQDRDKAMKELHEMKRKVEDKENINPTNISQENFHRVLDEIKVLNQEKQDLEEKLSNATLEADVAKGRRDWAFTERDKVMLESEGVQALCDKLRKERDKAVNDLIDKMKEINDLKSQTKINNENTENEIKSKHAKVKESGKLVQIDQKLDSSRIHGIVLDEGVFVSALTNNSVFARNNSLQVGDKILKVNNINVSDDLDQAREALNKHDSLSLTIERDNNQNTTKVRSSQSFASRRENDEKRSDFVSKMIQRHDSEPQQSRSVQAVSKLFTSSERVYNISSSSSSTPSQWRETKKPWTHFKENVKEKLELVKGRRQSTENHGEDEDKVDYCPAAAERGEKIKVGEVKDVETMMSKKMNIEGESEAESVDDEYQRYSLENLDNKIMEMKNSFAGPQTPLNSKSRFWSHVNMHPQDVVQSHFSQVQSRIQEKLTNTTNNKHSADQLKEDYFLASSASETSLNDSLKSGNLDEHQVICHEQEKRSSSHPEDDLHDFEKQKKQYSKYKDVFQFKPSAFHQYKPSNTVTSPKRTSPFPPVRAGLQPNHVYTDQPLYSPADAPPTYQDTQLHHRYNSSHLYGTRVHHASSSSHDYDHRFSSLPPDVLTSASVFPQTRFSVSSVASLGQCAPVSPEHDSPRVRPSAGDIRQYHIELSGEKLGITIAEVSVHGEMAGIFISRVSENSLAARYGLCVGDQLLEVAGINLRTAAKSMAATVLQGAGKTVDIKVQYNPDKYEQGYNCNSVESLYGYTGQTPLYSGQEVSPSAPLHKSTPIRSQSSTQLYSRSNLIAGAAGAVSFSDESRSKSSTLKSALNLDILHPAAHSTVLKDDNDDDDDAFTYRQDDHCSTEPRLLKPTLRKSGVLGVRLVGGNAVGIFIHSIEAGSAAGEVGLRRGDHILEYNGADLREATAEQAAYELAQPAESVSILVRYDPDQYHRIKDSPGDSYFIRALFNRTEFDKEINDLQLMFQADDLLWVDNTIFNGVPGNWSAWLLDKDGHKVKWGLIPSKYKVVETLRKRHKGKTFSDGVYEFSNSTRRSFLRKIRGNEATSSSVSSGDDECRELAVYSDVASLKTVSSPQSGYLRLEKRNFSCVRPVLVFGPLANIVMDKLTITNPSKFVRIVPEFMNSDLKTVEKAVVDNIFIDFKGQNSHYDCTTLRSVIETINKSQHGILDVTAKAVTKLQQNQIYPIVLMIKFRSVKQLKEVGAWDGKAGCEENRQTKDAKNMYEHALKLEQDYKHIISETVHVAHANIPLLCGQVAEKIDLEQKRPIWIPSGTIW